MGKQYFCVEDKKGRYYSLSMIKGRIFIGELRYGKTRDKTFSKFLEISEKRPELLIYEYDGQRYHRKQLCHMRDDRDTKYFLQDTNEILEQAHFDHMTRMDTHSLVKPKISPINISFRASRLKQNSVLQKPKFQVLEAKGEIESSNSLNQNESRTPFILTPNLNSEQIENQKYILSNTRPVQSTIFFNPSPSPMKPVTVITPEHSGLHSSFNSVNDDIFERYISGTVTPQALPGRTQLSPSLISSPRFLAKRPSESKSIEFNPEPEVKTISAKDKSIPKPQQVTPQPSASFLLFCACKSPLGLWGGAVFFLGVVGLTTPAAPVAVMYAGSSMMVAGAALIGFSIFRTVSSEIARLNSAETILSPQ